MQELKEHFITASRPWQEGAVDVFAQTFAAHSIKKATLAITALGVYEAQMNGKKVGTQMFAPGYTYYPRNLHTQTHDVASMISEGNNTLRVYLGQGWYCGRFTHESKTQIYGEKAAVSWVLTVEGKDGSIRRYSSDMIAADNEKLELGEVCALKSPYDYAGFYDGEIYYAEGAEKEGSSFVYTPAADCVAQKYQGILPEVLEEHAVLARLHEKMPVKSVSKHGDVTILDFGQNFAGVVEIDPAYMNGAALTLRHGEILNADGSLYTDNLRKAKAELKYHKGTDTKKYCPRFTYMGFRYVELSGVEYADGLLTAYVLHDSMERNGNFHCDNPLVQKLYENQVWGQKSNYLEVPTDCPQRDERQGYTGDGHVFALTGSYNFDTEAFWVKFLKDIRYSQMDNTEGYVAPTIPATGPAGLGFLSMLGWGNAVTILPEMLRWQYGTDRHLEVQYDSMKAFVEMEIRKMEDNNLWIAPSLGDWLMPGKDMAWAAMHNGPVSNAFIVNDLRILAETANRMGKQKDAERYSKQLDKTRQAYITTFMEADGRMKDEYQGAYIMALQFVLPKGDLWDKAFACLVENIREFGMQTGFFATEHILPLLASGGEAKLAYDLLLQEECPGWMYQVKQGATTIWERWDALRPDGTVNDVKTTSDNMVSFNHYAFGSVGKFYYQYILGIQPMAPGYEKIAIRPFVDERMGEVAGSYHSRKGRIAVSWKIWEDTVQFAVETPAETEIVLPDGTVHSVQAGSYDFQCNIAQ